MHSNLPKSQMSEVCSCHCSKSMKIDVQWAMMVIIAKRFHLFPFRTQKLSSYTSTIFGWRRPEKIDRCHQPDELVWYEFFFYILVEQPNIGDPQKEFFGEKKRPSKRHKLQSEYEQLSKSESRDAETARENRSLPSIQTGNSPSLIKKPHIKVCFLHL